MDSKIPEDADRASTAHHYACDEKYRKIILQQREELRMTIATARQSLVDAQNENDKLKFEIEDLRHENDALRSGLCNETSKACQFDNPDSDDELLLSSNHDSEAANTRFSPEISMKQESVSPGMAWRKTHKRRESRDLLDAVTPTRKRLRVWTEVTIRRNRRVQITPEPETRASASPIDPSSHEINKEELTLSIQPQEIPQNSKIQGVVISPAMVASLFRFEPLVAFPLDDNILIPLVSRIQLDNFYGGGHRTFAQCIRGKDAGHLQGRILVFPAHAPALTGHLPDRPGSHGLTFGSKRAIEIAVNDKKIRGLFLPTGPESKLFEYYGDYRMSFCGHLSKEQFEGQEKKVQQRIAQEICGDKSSTHLHMLARVSLRKQGIALSGTNVIEETKAVATTSCKNRQRLKNDVLDALLAGQERVAIVRLTCVGFDKVFVKDLIKRTNGEIRGPE